MGVLPSPLTGVARSRLEKALALVAQGEVTTAEQHLIVALAESPDHPDLLYGLGELQLRRGYVVKSIATLQAACAGLPGKVLPRVALARALAAGHRHEEAMAVLDETGAHARNARDWRLIAISADHEGYTQMALDASDRALQLEPRDPQALLLKGRSLQILGQIDAAARAYRQARTRPEFAARAWFALADLKTVPLLPGEITDLKRAAGHPDLTLDDRTMLAFAWGKALEEAGEFAPAFAAFRRANELACMTRFWNASGFSAQADSVAAAFGDSDVHGSTSADGAGEEVIFLVGLPRSGSTLIEQVLAAHSRVEGASELPYLNMVIAGESDRRRKQFPAWVADATAEDWRRMGAEYMRLSARWRTRASISTDKLPENWLLAGAALKMIPGARVIDCRRDPLETCWSCYKQLFAPGRVGFAYGFDSLATYWHDYVRVSRIWAERFGSRFRLQQYEAFLADPEAQTRALLEFCGLEFESGCLRFYEARRPVRTASAAQVRQPLQLNTARANDYGELLDPLRRLLETRIPD